MKNKIEQKKLKTWGGGGACFHLMQYGLSVLYIKEKKESLIKANRRRRKQ